MSSQLARAVEVMDRLRAPGGCAWDAEQTHVSLTRYLLEEAYEVLEAIEAGPQVDYALLREELGDLLLQVLFHARIASERPDGFDIEDVAGDLADKLVRRHPHVFETASDASAADLNETWERNKITEKGRTSATDGVPTAQPALALAAKLISRANRAELSAMISGELGSEPPKSRDHQFGERLFELVREAVAAGVDPEGALRRTTLAYRAAIHAAERRS